MVRANFPGGRAKVCGRRVEIIEPETPRIQSRMWAALQRAVMRADRDRSGPSIGEDTRIPLVVGG